MLCSERTSILFPKIISEIIENFKNLGDKEQNLSIMALGKIKDFIPKADVLAEKLLDTRVVTVENALEFVEIDEKNKNNISIAAIVANILLSNLEKSDSFLYLDNTITNLTLCSNQNHKQAAIYASKAIYK